MLNMPATWHTDTIQIGECCHNFSTYQLLFHCTKCFSCLLFLSVFRILIHKTWPESFCTQFSTSMHQVWPIYVLGVCCNCLIFFCSLDDRQQMWIARQQMWISSEVIADIEVLKHGSQQKLIAFSHMLEMINTIQCTCI